MMKRMPNHVKRSFMPVAISISIAFFGMPQVHAAVGDATSITFQTANSAPLGILSGPGNDLWVAQSGVGRVARVSLGQAVTEVPISGSLPGEPQGLAVGRDNRVWATMPATNRIVAITPGTNASESFVLPNAGSQPIGITSGPDDALWFTEREGNRIGRITTNGQLSAFVLETSNAQPTGITLGPDGALWFTMLGANAIGRITPGGVVSTFTLPSSSSTPTSITQGPDRNLWFTLPGVNSVGRITPGGVFAEFTLPTPNSGPAGITVGADGNLWVAQSGARRVARVTPAGAVSEFALPDAAANPTGIAGGSDGNIWVTSPATNRLYRILTGLIPVVTEAPTITVPGTSIGQVLTASQGVWRFAPTSFAYEWQRCATADTATCVSIPDARSANYTLVQADTGQFLRVLVTVINANGSSIAAPSQAVRIAAATPTPAPPAPPAPAPVISGQSAVITNGVTVTLRGPNKVRRGLKRSYAVVFSDANVRGSVRIVLTNARGKEIRVIAKGRQVRPNGRAARQWVMPRNIKVRTVTLRATFTPVLAQRGTYPVVTLSKPLTIVR